MIEGTFIQSSPEEQLRKNGWLLQTTVGRSMEPMLYDRRSLVRIERLTRPPQKYDVLLFRRPSGEYVLHRVLRVGETACMIRGDNCVAAENVPNEWLLGVLTAFSLDGAEMTPVTDKKYQAYVRRHCWVYPLRDTARFFKRGMRKAIKILKTGRKQG